MLARQYAQVQVELKAIEAKLLAWHRADGLSRRLAQIPGVGPVTAAALVMKAPDPHAFRSGRLFAAWVVKQAKARGRGPRWLIELLKRKTPKLAAVALANKMARIAWKLMTTGESYDCARIEARIDAQGAAAA